MPWTNKIIELESSVHWNCPKSGPTLQGFHFSVTRVPGKRRPTTVLRTLLYRSQTVNSKIWVFSTKWEMPSTYSNNDIHVVGWETRSYMLSHNTAVVIAWIDSVHFVAQTCPKRKYCCSGFLMSCAAGYDQNPTNTSVRVQMHELWVAVAKVQMVISRAVLVLRISCVRCGITMRYCDSSEVIEASALEILLFCVSLPTKPDRSWYRLLEYLYPRKPRSPRPFLTTRSWRVT